MILTTWLAALALITTPLRVMAAKNHDFKLCQQQSFCRRLRGIADRADNEGFISPYSLESPVTTNDGKDGASWTFPMKTSLYEDIKFELRLDILKQGDGIARIRVDEVGSKLDWKRYDEAAKWALVDADPARADLGSVTQKTSHGGQTTTFTYGSRGDLSLEIKHSPLLITFKQGGDVVMVINERNLFHMEHFRMREDFFVGDNDNATVDAAESGDAQVVMGGKKEKPDTKWFEGEPDKDAFEERWKTWADAKPKGLSDSFASVFLGTQ